MSGWASLNDNLRVGDSVFSTAFFPAVSPLPPIAVAWVLADESLAPKCPLIPQVDTSGCAHFRHHPHLVILRLDGTERTLTEEQSIAEQELIGSSGVNPKASTIPGE